MKYGAVVACLVVALSGLTSAQMLDSPDPAVIDKRYPGRPEWRAQRDAAIAQYQEWITSARRRKPDFAALRQLVDGLTRLCKLGDQMGCVSGASVSDQASSSSGVRELIGYEYMVKAHGFYSAAAHLGERRFEVTAKSMRSLAERRGGAAAAAEADAFRRELLDALK